MAPRVSIIIAAYQADAFLSAVIETCRSQTLDDFEVIIVDDASPISLQTAVQQAANGDTRFKFHRLESNQGPAAARNHALENANGDYVAILDADDLMAPDRLQRLVELADRREADIVADNMLTFEDERDAKPWEPYFDLPSGTDDIAITLTDFIASGMDKFGQSLGYCKPLFRRRTIDGGRHRYSEDLRNSEDYYFVAELLAQGAKMHLSTNAGYYYRRHSGSLSYRLSTAQAKAIAFAESEFRAKHYDALGPAGQALSVRRERSALRAGQFETIVQAIKAGNPIDVMTALLRNPASAPQHIGGLLSIAFGKLNAQR